MIPDQSPAGAAWPSVSYEELPWRPDGPLFGSRRERAAQRGVYHAAVPARIAGVAVPLRTELAAAVDDATNDVARFDAELGAEIAPFASVLLRTESAASSRIENLTASAGAIAMAELGDTTRHNAAMIVANVSTMRAALDLAEQLDANAIRSMHRVLMGMTDPAHAGAWRTEQVWVGGSDLGPGGAAFVPPHHERVPAAIADLVTFLAREDVPVLAHAAIAHAQFETIHPFTDGNGRTGRALLHAVLRAKGLTRAVTTPISAGLLAAVEEYFAALDAFREGDHEVIVSVTVRAAFAAVENGRALAADMIGIRADWRNRVNVRAGARTWDVADLLLRQPVVNAAVLERELGIASGHVRRHMDRLAEAGVVVEVRGRGVLWRAPEVLAALDAFAERAGRRRRVL